MHTVTIKNNKTLLTINREPFNFATFMEFIPDLYLKLRSP